MSLTELVDNTRTDKNTTHSYFVLYEKLLHSKKYTAKNVLEIGIGDFVLKNGGSIKLWRDYFINATVFALDILPPYRVINELFNDKRVVLYTETDAYNEDIFNSLFLNKNMQFDFMLDDGPHTLDSMKQFIKLYSQLMTEDGILIIEDIPNWDWIAELTNIVPDHLKQFVIAYDLRDNKNQFDDIVFTIDKTKINE
jgi:hypothetical protein